METAVTIIGISAKAPTADLSATPRYTSRDVELTLITKAPGTSKYNVLPYWG